MKYFIILPVDKNEDITNGYEIKEITARTSDKDNYLRYDGGTIDKVLLNDKFWAFQFPNIYSTEEKAEKAFKERIKDHRQGLEDRLKQLKNESIQIKKEIESCKKFLK